jgi:hypothetical protein
MKEFEYEIVSKHYYIIDELGKHKTLIEKLGKGNIPSIYKIRKNKKTIKVTSEYYHNEFSKTQPIPKIIQKKLKIEEKQKEYEKYSYFVSVDLETKKDHQFHAEFQIISPTKLSVSDLEQLIIKKYPDYHNALVNAEYSFIEHINKVNSPVSLQWEMSKKIRRR